MDIEKSILKKIISCNKTYHLFDEKEKIVIAISGGKDSMTLLKIMAKVHDPSLLLPVHIYPYEDTKILENIRTFAESLSIKEPVVFLENPLYKLYPRDCYKCARGRRKSILETAEKYNIKKIALGHNKNDVAETFLMNIIYSGNVDTIKPYQDFFGGAFQFIRPLFFVEEKEILRYKRIYSIIPEDYKCEGKPLNSREFVRNFLENFGDKKIIQRTFVAALKANDIK